MQWVPPFPPWGTEHIASMYILYNAKQDHMDLQFFTQNEIPI